jgi:putative ABC transport system permease protein
LQNLEFGFQPEGVLTVRTSLARARYGELPKRAAFYKQVLERVRTLPGVIAAGYTTAAPLTRKGGTNGFSIEGRERVPGQEALHRQVSSDYFRAVGIGLREGRQLEEWDGLQSVPVAVINETMARQFWPNENALGKRFKLGPTDSPNPWLMIVGITKDHKQIGLEAPVKAEMYLPYAQVHYNFNYHPRDLVIRTAGDPEKLIASIKREIWSVDSAQPISNIRLMDEILQAELAQRRIGSTLMIAFASLSLLLTSLGIYGVLSYAVTLRTQEIGIRMALGASRSDVLRIVIGQGMKMTLRGVAIGLVAAFALTRLLADLLYGVSATDPITFAVIALLLAGVALLACYLPARRATRVDPLIALRSE